MRNKNGIKLDYLYIERERQTDRGRQRFIILSILFSYIFEIFHNKK